MSSLAITGFPGWLTCALLDDYKAKPFPFDELRVLAHPSSIRSAQELSSHYPWTTSSVPFDLGNVPAQMPELQGVDVVVHAAAVIHVRRTSDWYRINAKGTIALAKAAKAAGARRFVFVSSIAAAGRSAPERHLTEQDEPRPMHHYGRSKLIAERAIMELHEPGLFEIVILRPSMFYGPPVPQRHVEIYRRIIRGKMPLIGRGNYKRSLVHIDNLVQAVELAITVPAAGGQTYFIVDRPVYTTHAVVEAMAEALGTKPNYLYLPHALAEVAYQVDRALSALGIYIATIHLVGESHWHQSASCEKAMRELGYSPGVELREGMRSTIEWCRRNKRL